ncbi:MAG: S-methyl-5-thioribose-1-phosphate isomerase [Planctomycetota bacterium]|nr:S-methyl-5-thioribose-1-phosphate isomerase [Planctomycetota bacterium]
MSDDSKLKTIEILASSGDVRILDQVFLPHALEYRDLSTCDEAAEAISVMRVRGAPLIGATAACGMALAVKTDATDKSLTSAAAMLRATRPTAVNLGWALERCLGRLLEAPVGDRARIAYEEAAAIISEDASANEAIGRHGMELIKELSQAKDGEPVNILTHCNAGWLATTHLGTATAPIYLAHRAGIPIHVWIDETRPRSQGAALTAWELVREGIPCDVIADNAGGLLMQRGQVDMVITGADRVAANGDVCNKIGTYLKALAARESEVPFCVAVPTSTIDADMPDGSCIPIEERDPLEVLTATGLCADGTVQTVQTAADGVAGCNPAFDITPAHMVTVLVTECGLIKPGHAGDLVASD